MIDVNVVRRMLAECVIEHEYPFEWVEHRKVRELCCYLNKDFKPISRNTCKGDCLKIHLEMKEELKSILGKVSSKISLTCDMWSSCTSDGYLCLTAHYVNDDWKLCFKILNFFNVPPPHSATYLYNTIYGLLREWGIEKKICSITLDNASNMNNMQELLRFQLDQNDALVAHGKYFHVRCCAHILNLIVQSGLEVIKVGLLKIRECVKYVEGSEGRKIKFRECVAQAGFEYSKGLWLDVPTRWNSTYLMIERFLYYRSAFEVLSRTYEVFALEYLADYEFPWIEHIFQFLKPFYDITLLFSGSDYPTANLYFENVFIIQKNIEKELLSTYVIFREMALNMKNKFSKYWEEHTMVLSFACILDPRFKLQLLQYLFPQLGSQYEDSSQLILEQMKKLFEEYKLQRGNMSFRNFGGQFNSNKSELESYLEENREDYELQLDVLDFLKKNEFRYPTLSRMARDILSIPITIVALESAFSIGGRVITKWRSSLTTTNAEVLITTRNWLYGYEEEVKIKDNWGRKIKRIKS
ncbi:hypothetical protein COLO4_19223 [Corchorus olitorius]|uniref:HAT C-terminal dimerisation domain-containing protein n=1 Tax=Corchorus olitorius TaxID=93759 RepID=A0A1R3J684_9ROSI|nr:hypothetical protein COLO4_19223 [Corchorus olitorius]